MADLEMEKKASQKKMLD